MRPRYLSQSYGWPTTRRHPRSLAEAFPREHANPIARYPGTPGRIHGWLLAVAIGLGLALATVHWWTT